MNFVVVIYDVAVEHKHHAKIRKLLRQYLHNVQYSCFQGFISDRNLHQLVKKLEVFKMRGSSILLYQMRAPKYLEIHDLGYERLSISNVICGNSGKIE